MAIDLYYMLESPPCRAVLMVARHLNITLNLKNIDFTKKEHLNDSFVKINPQHCVPTIVDDGFVLWESRAIITYLVNQYSPGSSLYPSDPKKRAVIDRLLQYDIGTLYKHLSSYLGPLFFGGSELNEEFNDKFKDSLNYLDSILSSNDYVAGDGLTLADLSLIASLSLGDYADYDYTQWKNVIQWIERLKRELSYYDEINTKAIDNGRDYVKMLKQNKE